jgi:hypothetical protein
MILAGYESLGIVGLMAIKTFEILSVCDGVK